jgi:hypothetical protein
VQSSSKKTYQTWQNSENLRTWRKLTWDRWKAAPFFICLDVIHFTHVSHVKILKLCIAYLEIKHEEFCLKIQEMQELILEKETAEPPELFNDSSCYSFIVEAFTGLKFSGSKKRQRPKISGKLADSFKLSRTNTNPFSKNCLTQTTTPLEIISWEYLDFM